MTGNLIRLHEATQRGLCRLAFLMLGLVPLGVCLVLSLLALTPGHAHRQARGWERRLALVLGFTVKIDSAECRAPFQYRFQNIRLLHPESQRNVGELKQLELRWESDRWRVRVEGARVSPDQLWQASRLFHDWHVCRPDTDRRRMLVEMERLAIEDGQRSWMLSKVRAEMLPDLEKWALKATFRPDDNAEIGQEDLTNQLLVFRNHHPDNSTTEIQLRAEIPIPLWIIETSVEPNEQASFLQSLARGLENSQFTGVMDARLRAAGPSVYLTNAWIRGIELGHLGAGTLPLVSGRGDLVLNQAILDSSGLRWAEGSIIAGPGRIDQRFLTSLGKHLGLELNQLQGTAEFLGFDQLSARFRLQPNALQLIGGTQGGGLIIDAHGALAVRKDTGALPITELIYALASTPKASPLVRSALLWLPLDEQQRRDTSQALRISRN
jgi:hypothetical protein